MTHKDGKPPVNLFFGSSGSWWCCYCSTGRMAEHLKSKSTGGVYRPDVSPCKTDGKSIKVVGWGDEREIERSLAKEHLLFLLPLPPNKLSECAALLWHSAARKRRGCSPWFGLGVANGMPRGRGR